MINIDYEAITNRTTTQLERSGILDHLEQEAQASFVREFVYLSGQRYFEAAGPGQRLNGLVGWYKYLREECSQQYATLKDQLPDADRVDINDTPHLRTLNVMRSALRSAVKQSDRNISRSQKHPRTIV